MANEPMNREERSSDDSSAPFRAVAEVDDAAKARRVILRLEHAGVDPEAISLRRTPQLDGSGRPRQVVRRTLLGAGLGALLFGAAATLFVLFPDIDGARWPGLFFIGAAFGALLGGVLGASTALGVSPAWTETFSTKSGVVAVGVSSDDPDDVARATAAVADMKLTGVRSRYRRPIR